MSDFLDARREASTDRDQARERIAQRRLPADERAVQELQAIRRWLFWGPFWAIIATGGIAAGLWTLTLLF